MYIMNVMMLPMCEQEEKKRREEGEGRWGEEKLRKKGREAMATRREKQAKAGRENTHIQETHKQKTYKIDQHTYTNQTCS